MKCKTVLRITGIIVLILGIVLYWAGMFCGFNDVTALKPGGIAAAFLGLGICLSGVIIVQKS